MPQRLVEQPLFAAQEIPTLGFGIRWGAVDPEPDAEGSGAGDFTGLRTSLLRAEATRKTLMPAMMHLCEARAQAELN